jgi:hypothetical protein
MAEIQATTVDAAAIVVGVAVAVAAVVAVVEVTS